MSIRAPMRRLVSQESAALIQSPNVPRSRFMGSFMRKTAFNASLLVPFLVDEILPGDVIRYNVTAFIRQSTPFVPVMDNQRVETFFFFVPNRLVWSNWKKMMGEQTTAGDSIGYVVPQLVSPAGGHPVSSIYDYMGLPVAGQIAAGQTISVNALPFRAYNLIYNEWFKDQSNVTTAVPLNTGDGPDTATAYTLYRRAKFADYFTTALPWPQKFTAPSVAIGGLAPVKGLGFLTGGTPTTVAATFNETAPTGTTPNPWPQASYSAYYPGNNANIGVRAAYNGSQYGPQVFADLSSATGVSINTLRQAFLTQQLLERDARGGTRYTEIIRAHFGVVSPDARQQRPEYIGGGQSMVSITPIANTSNTSTGALSATGSAAGSHRASIAATEHGYVIGLVNVRAEQSYSQGLHKMWTRTSRYDFYWPSLAQMGEQAILRQELYCTGNDTDDATIFGYQERWQEYRTRYSDITGVFRPTAPTNIDEWHISEAFATAPVLGTTFIEDQTMNTLDRVLQAGATARTNNQQFFGDFLIERDAVRPLPMYGTPATLGRF